MTRDSWSNTAKDFYDAKAKTKSNPKTFHAFVSAYRGLIKRLPEFTNSVSLDVGCGTGYLSTTFSDLPVSVYGIDISGDCLRAARTSNLWSNFIQADMTAIPFAAESFDLALAITSIEFCHDRMKVLEEISRCLKNNGCLYLEVRNSDFPLLKLPAPLLRILEAIGWINPYRADGFHDLSYLEWRHLIELAALTVEQEFPSLRPWNYGSCLTKIKNLIIRIVASLTPLRMHYMLGFYCRKKSKA